jgi:phage protein U
MTVITSLSDLSRIREGVDAVSTQLKRSGPVMMMLGPFQFAMDTAAFQRFNRATEYRWPSQARIGRRPALQYVGPGAETIDLEGIIYPEFAGGTSQVSAMRELAGLGKPMILVDGFGIIYDEWAILRIEETRTLFKADSTPKKVIFRLALSRYGKDQPSRLDSLLG